MKTTNIFSTKGLAKVLNKTTGRVSQMIEEGKLTKVTDPSGEALGVEFNDFVDISDVVMSKLEVIEEDGFHKVEIEHGNNMIFLEYQTEVREFDQPEPNQSRIHLMDIEVFDENGNEVLFAIDRKKVEGYFNGWF